MSAREKRLNLENYEYRILPYYVPVNTVLLQESPLGKKVMVKDSGLRFTFGKGVARKIELKTLDFKEQKIDGEGQLDIYLDFSVDYQIGARLDEDELKKLYGEADDIPESKIIKSKNRDIRRAKIFKIFLRAENNLDVSMEQILMNIVRKKLTGMPFEIIQKIGSDGDLFDQIKNEYYAECLDKLGVEIIDLRISNINLSNDVNKLFNEKRIAKEQAKIKKIEAKGDKEATLIRANAERDAAIIAAQGKAEEIKLTEDAKNKAYANRVETLGGLNYKESAVVTEQSLGNITENNINLTGAAEVISATTGAVKKDNKYSEEELMNKIFEGIESYNKNKKEEVLDPEDDVFTEKEETVADNVNDFREVKDSEIFTDNTAEKKDNEDLFANVRDEVIAEAIREAMNENQDEMEKINNIPEDAYNAEINNVNVEEIPENDMDKTMSIGTHPSL